jgi:hypothetical protein
MRPLAKHGRDHGANHRQSMEHLPWNLGYIPVLDGITAATSPMIEGLVYPAVMGLTNAIDRTGGPYASMLRALSNHIVAVLVPGKCLDATSGAWLSTSATRTITWQSKNFICQYVAEAVLGITNNSVNGTVDQIHASLQIQDAPLQGFSDALNGTGVFQYSGGVHYPRGITSSLWWLNATNNPSDPVASSVPGAPGVSRALAGDRQVLLLWQGVPFATGYNLKRATISGGPYTAVTNGVVGASFADSGLNNGTTYYYILTAANEIGESAPSPEASATPCLPSARISQPRSAAPESPFPGLRRTSAGSFRPTQLGWITRPLGVTSQIPTPDHK